MQRAKSLNGHLASPDASLFVRRIFLHRQAGRLAGKRQLEPCEEVGTTPVYAEVAKAAPPGFRRAFSRIDGFSVHRLLFPQPPPHLRRLLRCHCRLDCAAAADDIASLRVRIVGIDSGRCRDLWFDVLLGNASKPRDRRAGRAGRSSPADHGARIDAGDGRNRVGCARRGGTAPDHRQPVIRSERARPACIRAGATGSPGSGIAVVVSARPASGEDRPGRHAANELSRAFGRAGRSFVSNDRG